jgi:hypothetical protein
MRRSLLASAVLAFAASPALAHHSDAPHYLVDETVEITGAVVEWRVINPHSLLTLSVEGENGLEEYECETGGPNGVRRLGLDSAIKTGDIVTVTAAPGRIDPYVCLMRAITLADGRTASFGGAVPPPPPRVVELNSSIFGVWAPTAGGPPRPTGALQPGQIRAIANVDPMLAHLTPEGRAAVEVYEPYSMDPARQCSPVNPRRLWNAVGTPFSLTQEGDDIVLRHEFMDGVRVIHMTETEHPADGERSVLGHSIGHFEGDVLVVDTANFSQGVMQQYVLDAEGNLRGSMHSDAYHMVERISFDPETLELVMTMSSTDPKFYTEPFPDLTRRYRTSPNPVEPYECVPDEHIPAPAE